MPIKFLGRVIDDRMSVDELEEKLNTGLSLIDKSFFGECSQKLWVLQHLLVPRIQWPLMIYEVSFSVGTKLEQRVSVFIRK